MGMAELAVLGAGAMSSAGSMINNQQNIKFQREANDTQIALANTAHQREVRDLIAAGINPVLTASGSGASVPQLGTPSLDNPARGLSDSIQSATRLAKLDIPLKESQTLLNSAQAHNLIAQGELFDAQAEVINSARETAHRAKVGLEDVSDWLGQKWSQLFDKAPEESGLSRRTLDWLMQQTPEAQERFFNRLDFIRQNNKGK